MTNAIKIFLRRFYRNRVFGLLNISGLAVGIAISLVIFLIIQNELGIDRFHKNRDRIYRVVSTETFRNGIVDHDGDVPIPLPDALRAEFPQPEKVAAMYRYWELKFTIPGNTEKNSGPKMSTPPILHCSIYLIFPGSPEIRILL